MGNIFGGRYLLYKKTVDIFGGRYLLYKKTGHIFWRSIFVVKTGHIFWRSISYQYCIYVYRNYIQVILFVMPVRS